MNTQAIQRIVIVGGGTAGWMTAAAFSKALGEAYSIRLIESDEIGIIGVGEATIPLIQMFNGLAKIDEASFLKSTQGTFKLGIEFVNWGKQGDNYFHGFGQVGRDQKTAPFYQYWLKMFLDGHIDTMEPYSINTVAARKSKFSLGRPDLPNSPLSDMS